MYATQAGLWGALWKREKEGEEAGKHALLIKLWA